MPEDIEKEIESREREVILEERLKKLEETVEDFRNHQHLGTDGSKSLRDTFKIEENIENFFNDYFSAAESSEIRTNIDDKIGTGLWNRYFYYITFFESLPAGIVDYGDSNVAETGLYLRTGTNQDEFAQLRKFPRQTFLTFDEASRFRTVFRLSNLNSQATIAIGRGGEWSGQIEPHYGFLIENGKIYGTCASEIAFDILRQKVELMDISANYVYEIRAEITPNDKIIFYVSDGLDAGETDIAKIIRQEPKKRGELKQDLPTGLMAPNSATWIHIGINNEIASSIFLEIAYFEYLQRRQRL